MIGNDLRIRLGTAVTCFTLPDAIDTFIVQGIPPPGLQLSLYPTFLWKNLLVQQGRKNPAKFTQERLWGSFQPVSLCLCHPATCCNLCIIAIPPSNKKTNRYRKGELDIDSIIAFLTHQRESGGMPTEILRVRGRLRDAFPGFRTTKTSIRAAYEKAGWDINELSLLTKKQVREFGEVTHPVLTMCFLIHREEQLENLDLKNSKNN
jgi:hypothetical protein